MTKNNSAKVLLALVLCLGLATATLNIPLSTQSVTKRVENGNVQVDNVLYVNAKVSNLGQAAKQDEKLLLDLESNTNYVISNETKYGATTVSGSAFSCNNQCQNGVAQESTVSALGGRAQLSGGNTLKAASSVEVHGAAVNENVYVPATVSDATLEQNLEILKFANGALSLGRTNESLTSKLANSNNKLVDSSSFSLYLHEQISQLNVGGQQEYFKNQNSNNVRIPTNSKAGWAVTVSDVVTDNQSVLQNGAPLTAHFDTTSEYIYLPHIDADPSTNSTAYYYFMTSKHLPCFQPDNNVATRLSFLCSSGFSYESYNPITLSFKTDNEKAPFKVVLQPRDYIRQVSENTYELLFRFASAPQNTKDIYLGTAFLKKFYTLFNADRGTITLQDRFQVNTPVNGAHISDSYRIPLIVVGSLVTLAAVGILLAILKKVKVDQEPVELSQYQSKNTSTQPVVVNAYNPVVNTSYNPVVLGTVYNPQQVSGSIYNPVVSSNTLLTNVPGQNPLRQSQNMIRQSQAVRSTQNYVVTQNY